MKNNTTVEKWERVSECCGAEIFQWWRGAEKSEKTKYYRCTRCHRDVKSPHPEEESWEFQLHQRVGQLRQWLNERTEKRLITNEDIYTWLEPESLNLPSVQEAKAEMIDDFKMRFVDGYDRLYKETGGNIRHELELWCEYVLSTLNTKEEV